MSEGKRWGGDAVAALLKPDGGSMVLRQTMFWSRAMLWTLVWVTVAVLVWACVSEMDEVVHATGKLQPTGQVQEVRSAVGGVASEILVREGQRVATGEVLVRLDTRVALARLKSLQDQVLSLRNEQAFYERLFRRERLSAVPTGVAKEIVDLAKNHASLTAEDDLLRAIIDSKEDGFRLDPDQKKMFTESEKDRIENLERIRGQLEQARLLEQNAERVKTSFEQLLASGAGSRVDFLQREAAWIDAVSRVKTLEVQERNLATTFRREAMTRLGENTKRLAELEANLTKTRLESALKLADTEGRLEAASDELALHEIRSPSEGIVFEIVSVKAGHVLGAKDTVLKIVPSEELVARVDVTNRDIGFISTGLHCEVEVDTFPKREFGHLEGEVVFVGSDALPPDDVKRFYSFPVRIRLDRQDLSVRGRSMGLQSGMSVSANIKVRQRRVIDLFLDSLIRPLDRVKEMR